MGVGSVLNKVPGETSPRRGDWSKDSKKVAIWVSVWGKSISGKKRSSGEDLEVESCLTCSRGEKALVWTG